MSAHFVVAPASTSQLDTKNTITAAPGSRPLQQIVSNASVAQFSQRPLQVVGRGADVRVGFSMPPESLLHEFIVCCLLCVSNSERRR